MRRCKHCHKYYNEHQDGYCPTNKGWNIMSVFQPIRKVGKHNQVISRYRRKRRSHMNVLDITVEKLYGAENLCERCHIQPIQQVIDKDKPSVRFYRKTRKGKTMESELIAVSYQINNSDDKLCYYCSKIAKRLLHPFWPEPFNKPRVTKRKSEEEYAEIE